MRAPRATTERQRPWRADDHELESLRRRPRLHARAARRASRAPPASSDVRVRGEELLANWFGWANRALEATADPETVPWLWSQYAYRGYLALQHVDRALLEPRLPPAIFYNLMVAATKR